MLLPDTETLADRPKPCLAEVQELPRDWAKLFDGQLYGLGEYNGVTCSYRSSAVAGCLKLVACVLRCTATVCFGIASACHAVVLFACTDSRQITLEANYFDVMFCCKTCSALSSAAKSNLQPSAWIASMHTHIQRSHLLVFSY